MTETEKKALLTATTEEANDSVLSYALLLAKDAILNKAFPFLSDLPESLPAKYESRQLQIAEYLILKQGASGEKERTENGIRQVFESGGIPESMLRDIVPRMKTLRQEPEPEPNAEQTESEGADEGT